MNLNVVVDAATLTGQTPDVVKARCEIEGAGAITRAALEQLACDGTVTRIVTAAASVVLDRGRRTRVVTPAQKRALTIRDRHCRFPGCRRPAHWTDAHHITSWLDGGPTNLDNLVLVCRRHHTMIHTTAWAIARHPNGELHTPPRTHDPPAQAA